MPSDNQLLSCETRRPHLCYFACALPSNHSPGRCEMKGTSVTAITWSLCSAACSTSSSGLFMWKPPPAAIYLPSGSEKWLKTLPCTLQGENGYFHQAVDEYGVCQGASSFWRPLSHSLTHPIYIYTPILLEFSLIFSYICPLAPLGRAL